MVLSTIAAQWQFLTRQKRSVIYQLVSTRTASGYVGMDEFRIYTEQYREHLTNIRERLFGTDKKYAFVSRMGGPGSWFMVPYIFSSLRVPKQLILTLESKEIQLYPEHVTNEQRYRRKRVKTGTGSAKHAERAGDLPRTRWKHRGNAPVRLQLMYGSIDTPNVAGTDPTEAFTAAMSIYIHVHSSLLSIADRVPIQRHLGKSEVVCLALESGDRYIGSLNSALRWSSQYQGWLQFSYT